MRIAGVAAARQTLDRERDVARRAGLAMREQSARPSRPTIMPDDAVDIGVGDRAAADQPAVAQDGVAVADLEHLLQPVGDEDDRQALRLQVADDAEQLVDLGSSSAPRSARP